MPTTRPFISFLLGFAGGEGSAHKRQPALSKQHLSYRAQQHQNQGQNNQNQIAKPPTAVLATSGSVPQAQGPIQGPLPAQMPVQDIDHVTRQMTSTSPIAVNPPSSSSYTDRRNSMSSLNSLANTHSHSPPANSNSDYGSSKWWIGGRASDGSERFYSLNTQPLARHHSMDGISLDRLSI